MELEGFDEVLPGIIQRHFYIYALYIAITSERSTMIGPSREMFESRAEYEKYFHQSGYIWAVKNTFETLNVDIANLKTENAELMAKNEYHDSKLKKYLSEHKSDVDLNTMMRLIDEHRTLREENEKLTAMRKKKDKAYSIQYKNIEQAQNGDTVMRTGGFGKFIASRSSGLAKQKRQKNVRLGKAPTTMRKGQRRPS